ncbi:MAG: hypothetical protein ABF632_03205 [Gluconobacter japonicus]|uniref:hypothetical protein n=1 Tax=Gluconobacter japonicus TaxID=376620 RepID=UPI0039E73743
MSQDYPEAVYVGRYSNSWQIRRNKDDLDYDTLVEEPVAYIREDIAQQRENEAEARGAAEQRRKDAEGCEIVRQYLTSRNQWEDCSQDRIWAMAVESDATRRILYTPPPTSPRWKPA